MLRVLPSLGSDLAASRNASDSGPVPRGVNGSNVSMRRSTSTRLGLAHHLHVVALVAAVTEAGEPDACLRPDLAQSRPQRVARRQVLGLLGALERPPHGARVIEDDDDGGGSAAWATPTLADAAAATSAAAQTAIEAAHRLTSFDGVHPLYSRRNMV